MNFNFNTDTDLFKQTHKNDIGKRHLVKVISDSNTKGISPNERVAWDAIRKDSITATKVSSILNQNKYKSKRNYFLELAEYNTTASNTTESSSSIMQHGVDTEDLIKFIYTKKTNNPIININLLQHPIHKEFSATPDGCIPNEGALIEIKSVVNRTITDEIIIPYLMQMWFQMEITSMPLCRFVEAKLTSIDDKALENLITNKNSMQQLTENIYYNCVDNKVYKLEKFVIHPYIERNYEWFKKTKGILLDFHKKAMQLRKDPTLLSSLLKELDIEIEYTGPEYTPISDIRTIILDDPFLYWCKILETENNIPLDSSTSLFMNIYKEKEKIFIQQIETFLITRLIQLNKNYIKISNGTGINKSVNDTIKACENNIPVIFNPVLIDSVNKYIIQCDLLVQTSIVNELFGLILVIDPQNTQNTQNTNYIACSFKFSSFTIGKNNRAYNVGSVPYYKSLLYSAATSDLKVLNKNIALMFGRKYKVGDENILEWFKNYVIVDFAKEKEIAVNVNKAFKLVKEIKNNGIGWFKNDSLPLELYPNMKNKQNYPYNTFKTQYAKRVGEITLISYLTPAHRNKNSSLNSPDKLLEWVKTNINTNSKKYIEAILSAQTPSSTEENPMYCKLSPYMESRFMALEQEIKEEGNDIHTLDIVKNVIRRLQTSCIWLPDPNVNISGDGSISFGWTGVDTMPQFACNIYNNDLVIFTKSDYKPQRIQLTIPVEDSLTDYVLNGFTTIGLRPQRRTVSSTIVGCPTKLPSYFKSKKIFFIDFEIMNSLFMENFSNHLKSTEMERIICASICNMDGECETFYIKDLYMDSELKLIYDLYMFILKTCKIEDAIVIHWSPADVLIFEKCSERCFNYLQNEEYKDLLVNNPIHFYDLLPNIKNEINPVGIYGCFDYNIKSVYKGLYGNELNELNELNECDNGLDASCIAYEYMKCNENNEKFNKMLNYNKQDTLMLYKIYKYFYN